MEKKEKRLAEALIDSVINESNEETLLEVEEDHGGEEFIADKMKSIIKRAKSMKGGNR